MVHFYLFAVDKSGAVSADPLPAGYIRAGDIGREGVSRTDDRGRDHQRLF